MAANGANPSSVEATAEQPAAEPEVDLRELREGKEEEDPEEAEAEGGEDGGSQGQERQRWPGWPGASVFRVVVAAQKVGGIIGRKGETIKRLCEETGARIRVLDGSLGSADKIVLISAKEAESELSPAMDAAIRIFKHINEIEENDDDGTLTASTPEIFSIRLLVPSSQAVHLIGKQGATIKSIQESTGATIQILRKDELASNAAADERIVEIRGASLKVLNALKSVLGLLRKFLVDHGVLPLFEKKPHSTPVAQAQDSSKQGGIANGHPPQVNQDTLFSDRRSPLNPKGSRLILYGRDPSISGLYSSDLGRPTDALITQVTQTMHIPLPCAEEIIGVGGRNIAYIRHASGAVVTLQESRVYPDEILVEIKGSPSQVQTAQQLVQEFLSGNDEATRSSYSNLDYGSRLAYSSYSTPASSAYSSLYIKEQPYGGYGSSIYGGYRGYGL